MQQIVIPRHGAPDVLELRESTDPQAQEGEIRIRVKAAGVNFADLLARIGVYRDAPKPPCVVGFEVAGIVDQIGDRTDTEIKVGDRVLAMPRFGGYADVISVPVDYVFRMPDTMTFEQGAAFPTVYLAAHHALLYMGPLRDNSRVLVHSAAGGVGVAAIQLAKLKNCTVFGTASPSKHEFLQEIGCDHAFSYSDWHDGIRNVVKDAGVDIILDPVGGRSWSDSYDLLGPCGRMVCFGASMNASKRRNLMQILKFFAQIPQFKPLHLMNDNRQVGGFNLRRLFDHPSIIRPQMEALIDMFERGEVAPHVDRTFAFNEAAKAHMWLHDRKARGKVILMAVPA
ncbi:MAG: medium chain dehydrogenase/reductase family protein [Myxococcota bacterium]